MKPQNADIEVFVPQQSAEPPVISPGEIVIGEIAGIDAQGQPLVTYPNNPTAQPQTALTTVGITAAHAGRKVALLFAKGESRSPVIMGIIHNPLQELIVAYSNRENVQGETETSDEKPIKVDDLTIDGRRIVLEGREEVVIKCGEASITLTKAGKILIRGNYVLNRSSGMNRIMGGSVQVN